MYQVHQIVLALGSFSVVEVVSSWDVRQYPALGSGDAAEKPNNQLRAYM